VLFSSDRSSCAGRHRYVPANELDRRIPV